MENLDTTASAILEKALDNANGLYTQTADVDRVAKIVAVIGTMAREEYLALRALWRIRYRKISGESRMTKPQRKGGNTTAANRVQTLKYDARRYMAVRHALKECAREHAQAALPSAA